MAQAPTVTLSVVTDPEPTLVLPLPLRPDAPAVPTRPPWWRLGSAAWSWLTAADDDID